MLDVATDAETDAGTDSRYAGAIAVSTAGVPSVTLVQPTIAIRIVATQPIARAPTRSRDLGRMPRRPPISTASDVTGSRLGPASTGTTRRGRRCGTIRVAQPGHRIDRRPTQHRGRQSA